MKNKHLVVLFLGVVALGGLLRTCHLPLGTKLDSELFKESLAEVDKILICGKDTTIVSHVSGHWSISQNEEALPLPDSVALRLLGAIGSLKAVELLHTQRPDTLGLAPGQYTSVVCQSTHWPEQVFHFGHTIYISGVAHTWVGLPLHDQYYLTPGNFGAVVPDNMWAVTPTISLQTDTSALQEVCFVFNQDTLAHFRQDTAQRNWLRHPFGPKDTLSQATVRNWKRRWQQIGQTAKIAHFFDKKSSSETFCGELQFIHQQIPHTAVKYRLFFVSRPVLPDDPDKMRYFRNFKPQYVLESDLQPGFYFAVPDTVAIHQLKFL